MSFSSDHEETALAPWFCSCGAENFAGAEYCTTCGAPRGAHEPPETIEVDEDDVVAAGQAFCTSLADLEKCPRCDSGIPRSASRCPRCGLPTDKDLRRGVRYTRRSREPVYLPSPWPRRIVIIVCGALAILMGLLAAGIVF